MYNLDLILISEVLPITLHDTWRVGLVTSTIDKPLKDFKRLKLLLAAAKSKEKQTAKEILATILFYSIFAFN